MRWCTHWCDGLKRRVWPTMQTSPVRFCEIGDGLRIGQLIGERNLDLHVLAGVHALDRLRGVQLRRRAQDGGGDARARQRVGEIRGGVRHAILARDFFSGRQLSTDDRHHFDAVDQFARIEMLLAEGADACDNDLHRLGHLRAPG